MALQLSTIIDNMQEAISDLRNYHRLSQPLDDLRWESVYDLKTALESLKKFQKEWEQNEDEKKDEQNGRYKMTCEQVNQLSTKELVQHLNDCLLAIHFLCGGRHEIIEKDKNLKKAFGYLLSIGAINYALCQKFVNNEGGENNGRINK